jgi:hypothetical protein
MINRLFEKYVVWSLASLLFRIALGEPIYEYESEKIQEKGVYRVLVSGVNSLIYGVLFSIYRFICWITDSFGPFMLTSIRIFMLKLCNGFYKKVLVPSTSFKLAYEMDVTFKWALQLVEYMFTLSSETFEELGELDYGERFKEASRMLIVERIFDGKEGCFDPKVVQLVC